eukprot:scaffold3725_cov48-Phaeocystis_antarctica.AAC.2
MCGKSSSRCAARLSAPYEGWSRREGSSTHTLSCCIAPRACRLAQPFRTSRTSAGVSAPSSTAYPSLNSRSVGEPLGLSVSAPYEVGEPMLAARVQAPRAEARRSITMRSRWRGRWRLPTRRAACSKGVENRQQMLPSVNSGRAHRATLANVSVQRACNSLTQRRSAGSSGVLRLTIFSSVQFSSVGPHVELADPEGVVRLAHLQGRHLFQQAFLRAQNARKSVSCFVEAAGPST